MATWPPATHADAQSAIQELRTEAQLTPVSRYLPAGYNPGVTNIAPYVQAAVNDLETVSRGQLLMPIGTHLWDSPVYLDSPIREMSYSIIGHGKGTYIKLGTGLNGEFALHNNENSSGVVGVASPGMPRLTIADITLDGQAGTRGMVFSNAANVRVYNTKTFDIYRLVQTTGYCDLMEFRKIRVQLPNITGAVMYWNHGSGDGLIIEQISAGDEVVVADLSGCNGGVIASAIVGRYIIANCDAISVISPHNDGGDNITGYQQNPWFSITSSRVSFYGGWDQIGDTSPAIEINDTSSLSFSEVTVEGFNYGFRPHTATKTQAPHIKITQAQNATKLRLRRGGSNVMPVSSTSRYPGGPRLTATDSNIQAAFDAYPTALLEDVDLLLTDQGWQFVPVGGERTFQRIATAPTVAAASSSVVPGAFSPTGTYFYKIAVITDKGRALNTAASTETSVAVTGTNVIQLTTTLRDTPALVRIWRGTATGVYTAYVDVPVSSYDARLFDTGVNVAGYAWITTGIPTPPTTNTTMDGRVLGRQSIFHGTAAPTAGTWVQGDRVENSAPAASGFVGWVCTTGGTPGTWKTYGAISP